MTAEAGMLVGVGVDIIEVERIRAVCERHGDRFLERILRPPEIAYCRQFRAPFPHYAARFAAKEAVSKAFGTGIGSRLGWKDIEVANRPSGEPYIIFHGKAKLLLQKKNARNALISLSHTEAYAAAMAAIV